MRTTRSIAALVASCVVTLTGNPSVAGMVEGSGTVTYTVEQDALAALSGGQSLVQIHLKGVILANDASSPLHLSMQDCSGTAINDAGGAPLEDAGTCAALDKDGDVWWLWYHDKGNERTWTVISGTGKYEGMQGSGTTEVLVATADRLTIKWSGTLTMK